MRTWAWILILPLFGLYGLTPFEPSLQMVLIALSIFLLVKCQALWTYQESQANVPKSDVLAWFLAWPGLDADRFFSSCNELPSPSLNAWIQASAKTIFGMTLFLVLAPRLMNRNEELAGWAAMMGIVFVLHFGLFHILALAWRQAGRDVSPLMNAPALSTSLAEFWGRRWNIAFRDFTYAQVVRPLARRYGAATAGWGGFVFSGFLHELAISVPAHAGYGLPMCYFLLQGMGIGVERRAYRNGWWARGSVWGWLFTILFTVPGAYFLFHPPFVQRVILPLIPS